MDEITRQTLLLFTEKAEKLQDYIRIDNHLGGLIGVYSTKGENDWQWFEEINVFIMTFRWFLIPGRNVAYDIALYPYSEKGTPRRPRLLDLPGISADWKARAQKAWEEGTAFLALPLPNLGQPITRWQALEVFLYGDIVHQTQRDAFLAWQKGPTFGKFLLHCTDSLLFLFETWIFPLSEASKRELEQQNGEKHA